MFYWLFQKMFTIDFVEVVKISMIRFYPISNEDCREYLTSRRLHSTRLPDSTMSWGVTGGLPNQGIYLLSLYWLFFFELLERILKGVWILSTWFMFWIGFESLSAKNAKFSCCNFVRTLSELERGVSGERFRTRGDLLCCHSLSNNYFALIH